MSKAYDSVNIEMLNLALQRIKIPSFITTIILNLFNNRNNSVITPYGNTTEYSVEDGINQGDTISPLLWRIFYDPLLSKISHTHPGYTITSKTCTDLRQGWKLNYTNITTSAFMDDTTWIANNKQNLQQIITSAEQFYEINDIQTNPKKSELLIINGSLQERETGIILKEQLVKGSPPDTPVRILGIWHTSKGNKKFQIELIKQKVTRTKNLITYKRITDKQAKYIINHVLMPSIEYLFNDLVLPKDTCNSIMSKITTSFKHKIGLASTAPNNMIFNKLEYGFHHIFERQVLLHASNWPLRINSTSLAGEIARHKLQALQNIAWTPINILEDFQKITKRQHQNLTHDILWLLRQQGISFSSRNTNDTPTCIHKIDTTIQHIMGDTFFSKFRQHLHHHNLLFIEQLLNENQTKLLAWNQLTKPGQKGKRGRIPNWYTEIQKKINDPTHNFWQSLNNYGQINIFH